MRRCPLPLALIALAALPASAADWSDTHLGYRMGTRFQEPGIEVPIRKDIFSLGHVSGYSLGTNFFVVNLLKSDENDPANSASPGTAEGAHEVYAVYRHSLSGSKLFKTKLEAGILRDVEFTFGFDFNAKNTAFAPSVFKVLAGPSFSFKVPGFLNLGILYYTEKNHNAFGGYAANQGGGQNVRFDPTFQIAAAWGIDWTLGPVDTKVKGFANYTGAKGKDGSGVETVPETQVNLFWMADASRLLGAKKGTWMIGPGYEYWDAKFGDPTHETVASTPPGQVVNPRTSCFMVALEYHF